MSNQTTESVAAERESVRSSDWLGDNELQPSAERRESPVRSGVGGVSARVEKLKLLTGIEKANCWTCQRGHADSDGEPGATYHCGMVCSISVSDSTYIEDDGIDPSEEKECWWPNYWCAHMPEHDSKYPVTGESHAEVEASMHRSMDAFDALLAPFRVGGGGAELVGDGRGESDPGALSPSDEVSRKAD